MSLISAYGGRPVIVRSRSTTELINSLPDNELERVACVQLLSLNADVDALAGWGYAVPVELVMSDPTTEFPLLYRNAKLLDKHPLRVLIPAVNGFSKAVKVAASLQLSIRIELGQPNAEVIDELKQVCDYYLHQSLVSQPVEPFHSMLMSLYHGEPGTLWDFQERNASVITYIEDDGSERPAANVLPIHSECESCELFAHCNGYFKWPERDYSCAGVRSIFAGITEAANELRHEMESIQ